MPTPSPTASLTRRISRLGLAREGRLIDIERATRNIAAAPDAAACRFMAERWMALAILAAEIAGLQDARDLCAAEEGT